MNETEKDVVVLKTQLAALKEQVEQIVEDHRDLKKEIKEELSGLRADIQSLINNQSQTEGAYKAVGKAAGITLIVLSALGGFIMFLSHMFDRAKSFVTHTTP